MEIKEILENVFLYAYTLISPIPYTPQKNE